MALADLTVLRGVRIAEVMRWEEFWRDEEEPEWHPWGKAKDLGGTSARNRRLPIPPLSNWWRRWTATAIKTAKKSNPDN